MEGRRVGDVMGVGFRVEVEVEMEGTIPNHHGSAIIIGIHMHPWNTCQLFETIGDIEEHC